MGLLDNILSAVDNRKRVLKRNLFDFFDDHNGTAQVWADRASEDRYGGAEERQAVVNQIKGKPYDKQALARADQRQQQSALDQTMGAITVWHGSPHLIKPKPGGKYPEFDSSKIGTGEGAQAYGNGHYLAESDGLANTYRRKLTGTDGAPVAHPDQSLQVAIGRLQDQVNQLEKSGDASAPAMIKAYKNRIAELDGNGYLYKVDIPDEAVARFLDWDKPLSQQAPEVQAAMQSIKGKFPISKEGWDIKPFIDADPLFSTVHNAAVKELDIPANFFQKEFAAQGIPGIRYLDGGSRGQQAGTSNFVLFDDQMPRILEINGQPTGLLPWGKGEWKGLLE